MKVTRADGVHAIKDWTVQILATGDFDTCYTDGDNSQILATDTMKNTVYSRARASTAESMEEFATELIEFTLARNPQISGLEVEVLEKRWERTGDDMTTFKLSGPETFTTRVEQIRGASISIQSGVKGLVIMKTADSGFVGYIKDSLTTLPETEDRLFCTEADINWTYVVSGVAYNDVREKLVRVLLKSFANHNSLSVQQTLYAMGEAALDSEPAISEIEMTMPNRHCLLVNLKPFGQDNPNEIFVPTDEPHGTIQAKVIRS